MSGHTPGPWNVRAFPTNFSVHDDDGVVVCKMSWHSSHRIHYTLIDESRANALLIAAAPELLAALIAFEEFGNVMHVRKQISAAIAKATGKS